ncbi:MAG: LTA synthase family protein [Clostridium sp.]
MEKLSLKIKDTLSASFDKEGILRSILFLIPLVGITLKGVFLQGFIQNQNSYNLDLALGFSEASSFLNYYIAFALVFLSFALLFKGKGRIIYLFIIDALLTILFITDIWYFRGFLTVPSILIATQTANLDNMGGTITSMMSGYDVVFLLDFIILGIYVFFTRKTCLSVQRRAVKTFCATFILPIIFIAYVPFNLNVLDNKDVKNAWLFDNYDPTNTCKYFSSIGYHIFDVINVYRDSQPYDFTEEDKEKINAYYDFTKETLPNNEYFGMSKNKNLIIIQVESLETFIMGKEINGQKITPVMDELINKGLYFPNIYEQVNEGTSSDSDLMVSTSLLPLRRGSTFFRYPVRDYNSLPNILEKNGYETASIHPDKGSFWNYANALKGIGYDNFIDFYSFDAVDLIGLGISDESYFDQVVPMLEELKEPFLGYTITLTNHGPFDLPDELRKLNLDAELGANELGGYFESVRYTDDQIGKFLTLLDKAGILDNSIVAIVGDHTGVHKYYNHSIEKLSKKEDWYLYDGEPKIPLILYDKSSNTTPKTFETIGGQIDIMPTLLYALGIDKSEYDNTALGRNLLNTDKSFAVLTDGSVRHKGLTPEQEEIIKSSLDLSDKMIRGNYFSKDK